MLGRELDVRLERGRTFSLTARVGRDRIFVRESDPEASFADPGDLWRVRVVEKHRDELWRVELLDRLAEREQERHAVPSDAFRERAVPSSSRHKGNGTPEHLLPALETLPELIEVGFYWEDDKGPFGIHQGLVLRPTLERRSDRVAVQIGGRFLVTIACSGNRGLYAKVLACLEGPAGGTEERIPDRFEAQFALQDGRGVYAVYGSFVVRPDRHWPTPLVRGTKLMVWTVNVIRRSCNVAFVLPIGCTPNGSPVSANGVH